MAKEDLDRYLAAAHAVQTAIGYSLVKSPSEGSPKHLRVGIDTMKVEQSALATMLIEKGVFTLDEYQKAIADAMEREVSLRADDLSRQMGGKISLA
jgi:hypothetical protein